MDNRIPVVDALCHAWFGKLPQDWNIKPVRIALQERYAKNDLGVRNNYLSLISGVGIVPYAEKGDLGNKKPEDLSKCKCVEQGDFVINSMNFVIGGFGRSSFSGICSPVYIVAKPNERQFDPRFLMRVFQVTEFQRHVGRLGNGILELRMAIGWDELKNQPIPAPPLPEQTRIANFLDEQTARIDALIAEKERLVSTIEEYWRSYLYSSMQSAACLGLELPHEGWALEPVKRVCASIQTGRTPSGARDDCFTEDGVPWVTPGDMDDIFVKSSGKSVSYVALHDGEVVLYPPGSTLLVGIGATLGTVSNARVAVSANQQINILVPDPRKIDALFLTFAIKANQDQVRLSAGAATLPILNQERTGRLKIAIPRMEQQIATRNQLLRLRENANRLLSHVGRHLSILREYRSSLISAAVTGQLDIDSFEKGVA